MAEVTRSAAQTAADTIANETSAGANTAARVGGAMRDTVDSVLWNHSDVASNRPASGDYVGQLFFATDTGVQSRWDGSAWLTLNFAVPDDPGDDDKVAVASGGNVTFAFVDTANIAPAAVTAALLASDVNLAAILNNGASAGNGAITSLADPTNPQDAATKAYVDANIGGSTWADVLSNGATSGANNPSIDSGQRIALAGSGGSITSESGKVAFKSGALANELEFYVGTDRTAYFANSSGAPALVFDQNHGTGTPSAFIVTGTAQTNQPGMAGLYLGGAPHDDTVTARAGGNAVLRPTAGVNGGANGDSRLDDAAGNPRVRFDASTSNIIVDAPTGQVFRVEINSSPLADLYRSGTVDGMSFTADAGDTILINPNSVNSASAAPGMWMQSAENTGAGDDGDAGIRASDGTPRIYHDASEGVDKMGDHSGGAIVNATADSLQLQADIALEMLEHSSAPSTGAGEWKQYATSSGVFIRGPSNGIPTQIA